MLENGLNPGSQIICCCDLPGRSSFQKDWLWVTDVSTTFAVAMLRVTQRIPHNSEKDFCTGSRSVFHSQQSSWRLLPSGRSQQPNIATLLVVAFVCRCSRSGWDWRLELPHLAEREPHGALGRARSRAPSATTAAWLTPGRPKASRRQSLATKKATRSTWPGTLTLNLQVRGLANARHYWKCAHTSSGVTVVLFDDFVIVRSKTGSKRRHVPIGEREPLMKNSQLSTADDLWF